jgi:TPR repeat protein
MASWLKLAHIFESYGDRAKAFECYKSAAEKGHPTALFKFAKALEQGCGCTQDVALAARCYQLLIDQDNSDDAMVRLAVIKIEGRAGAADVEGGKALLRRAAQLGNRTALEVLRRLQ